MLEYPQKRGFFFASVKTTTQGDYEDNSRIKISVDAEELQSLSRFAVPVYLFGIDEVQEAGYFVSANHISTGSNLNGIPTRHPVDIHNIRLLWQEVRSFGLLTTICRHLLQISSKMKDHVKSFEGWRAEKLAYVYFSRFGNLIINEPGNAQYLFDLLIDVAENDKPTGRFFGVQVKAQPKDGLADVIDWSNYTNVKMPVVEVVFDTERDKGVYTWIKEPKGADVLERGEQRTARELTNDSIKQVIRQVEQYYGK